MNQEKLLRESLRITSRLPGVYSLVINPILRRVNFGVNAGANSEVSGMRFNLDLNDYTQRRAWCGVFENAEVEYIRSVLTNGDVAVDVGSNVGLLALPMARAVGEEGNVFAIDPISANIAKLEENARLNALGNIETVISAVGSSTSDLRFANEHTSADRSTGFYRRSLGGDGIVASQIRLDSFLSSRLGPDLEVQLVKIDVEGMEKDVLAGLGNLLNPDRIRRIMFEIFVDRRGVSKESEEVIDLLVNAGYRIFRLSRRGPLGISPLSDHKIKTWLPTAMNLLALK